MKSQRQKFGEFRPGCRHVGTSRSQIITGLLREVLDADIQDCRQWKDIHIKARLQSSPLTVHRDSHLQTGSFS